MTRRRPYELGITVNGVYLKAEGRTAIDAAAALADQLREHGMWADQRGAEVTVDLSRSLPTPARFTVTPAGWQTDPTDPNALRRADGSTVREVPPPRFPHRTRSRTRSYWRAYTPDGSALCGPPARGHATGKPRRFGSAWNAAAALDTLHPEVRS